MLSFLKLISLPGRKLLPRPLLLIHLIIGLALLASMTTSGYHLVHSSTSPTTIYGGWLLVAVSFYLVFAVGVEYMSRAVAPSQPKTPSRRPFASAAQAGVKSLPAGNMSGSRPSKTSSPDKTTTSLPAAEKKEESTTDKLTRSVIESALNRSGSLTNAQQRLSHGGGKKNKKRKKRR